MPKEALLMNRDEVKEALEQIPIAIFPLGATEQHGHHLPLGTDIFLAEGLSRKVANELGAVLLPALPFGYSWVWRQIPGTVSLEEDLVEEVIKNVAKSVARYGVKLLILIGGHDANNAAMKYAVRELSDELEMPVFYFFYPGLAQTMSEVCESPTWHGMIHACEFETSLMLKVRPDLVDMEKAVEEYPEKPDLYGKSPISLGDMSESGVYGNATLASAEKGETMFTIFSQRIVDSVRGFCKERGIPCQMS